MLIYVAFLVMFDVSGQEEETIEPLCQFLDGNAIQFLGYDKPDLAVNRKPDEVTSAHFTCRKEKKIELSHRQVIKYIRFNYHSSTWSITFQLAITAV